MKATGAPPAKTAADSVGQLRAAGQDPLDPPSVAGWPAGASWLGTSTTLARWNLAAALVGQLPPDAPFRRVPPDRRADALGYPDGFSEATTKAIATLEANPEHVDAALALALAAPETAFA